MFNKIINGRKKAQEIKNNIKKKIIKIKKKNARIPGLAVIIIGSNPASKIYVDSKLKACNYVNLLSKKFKLNNNISEIEIVNLILRLNNYKKIDGILIQLPLPININTNKIIEAINPTKDVDGFHPYNIGKLMQRAPLLRPCTPKGIMTLLNIVDPKLKKKHAVIIGASNIVGRPLIMELLLSGVTVTSCHKFTQNITSYIKIADILIVAIGKPNFIEGKYIKKNTIIIDVGINRINKNIIQGDVEFKEAIKNASYITPVPGGVGPMTIASLLENTILAYEINNK